MSRRHVFVAGKPAPQGSKRHVGRGILIESSKTVGPWRERVAMAAHLNARGLLCGPVSVRLDFILPRPKSAPRRSTPPATKRPDLDKLTRAVLDALTNVWLTDDSQVVHIEASKRIAEIDETPGVHITVNPLTDECSPRCHRLQPGGGKGCA